MQKLESVCIVGGGSAGWLTAAYLTLQLPQFDYTLIESPTVGRIGVGEATILTFVRFLEKCGVESEEEFLVNTDATFKSGILFKDWTEKGRDVWHPFSGNMPMLADGLNAADLYASTDESYDFFLKYVLPYYDTCVERNKVEDIRAYHFNADKVAKYFKRIVSPKLTYVPANVTNVNADGKNVTSLALDNGQTITSSLFIDCTGFRNIVASHVDGGDWVDKSDTLFCNAAVAATIKYDNEDEKTPYTTCQCHDDGWIFKVPVWSRIGSGLLYNSDLLTNDEAEKNFMDHWGAGRVIGEDFNHIKFKPTYNRRNWRGNVIGIGLASGFIEPLESSSIHLATDNVQVLAGRIRKGFYTDADRDIVNARMTQKYEETFDFVALHYLNSTYDTPFWNKVKNEMVVPESLRWRIERYMQTGSHHHDMDDSVVFAPHSWTTVFEGFHFRRKLETAIPNARELIVKNYNEKEKNRYQELSTNNEIFAGVHS